MEQNPIYNQSSAVSPPPPSVSLDNGTGFVKVKCPRSKSQPAFKDSSQINAINSQTGVYNNGIYSTNSNTNNNLNKYLIYEASRLTSSPICNFNSSTGASMTTEQPSPTSPTQSATKLLNNDTSSSSSSNPESSFYEDQLENELESISNPNGNIKSCFKNGTHKPIKQSSVKSNKPKQNHVSFNINNAIYTSRHDTPIPISVLKQQQQQQGSSPLQSSLKKSSVDDQPVIGKVKNKSVRIDAKTTIL